MVHSISLLLFDLAYWLVPLLQIGYLAGFAGVLFLVIRLLIRKNFPKKDPH